jgi:hypothetical protein
MAYPERKITIPEGYILRDEDIAAALSRLNMAAEHGNADCTFTFLDGSLVKKGWITFVLKGDRAVPAVTGRRRPKEF